MYKIFLNKNTFLDETQEVTTKNDVVHTILRIYAALEAR